MSDAAQVELSLTAMSEYDFRPGGSLKLKRTAEGSVVKKKKKTKVDKTAQGVTQDEEEPAKASPSGSNRNSPSIAGASDERKTAAEKRFQEVQRKRVRLFAWYQSHLVFTCAMQLADKVKKLAGKTHKDRVHEFNSKLEALSEHHDIPKVGPG
ncbi:hypothetical protein BJV74DRAFT_826026 [Russula compacta]|nr:hypothetical protein BJV74DRAFT_826026 [Russula compacta]